MSRLALSLALAALASLTPLHRAEAATFAPDMWVYEVELTVNGIEWNTYFYAGAYAKAPAGTPVPPGCDYEDLPDGTIGIGCYNTPNPGIDMIESADQSIKDAYFDMRLLLAFNSSTITCQYTSGASEFLCPTVESLELASLFPSELFNVVIDLQSGILAYCQGYGGEPNLQGCFSFRPDGVTGNASIDRGISGFWDYGFGGRWSVGDPNIGYAVTGRLISAPTPTPVPLPAGLPLLAVGLAAFGLMRRRRG